MPNVGSTIFFFFFFGPRGRNDKIKNREKAEPLVCNYERMDHLKEGQTLAAVQRCTI